MNIREDLSLKLSQEWTGFFTQMQFSLSGLLAPEKVPDNWQNSYSSIFGIMILRGSHLLRCELSRGYFSSKMWWHKNVMEVLLILMKSPINSIMIKSRFPACIVPLPGIRQWEQFAP